jgi:hypothetical protein
MLGDGRRCGGRITQDEVEAARQNSGAGGGKTADPQTGSRDGKDRDTLPRTASPSRSSGRQSSGHGGDGRRFASMLGGKSRLAERLGQRIRMVVSSHTA